MLQLVEFQKFMFSDRYHLTASALAGVCFLMMRLMLWINFFNHCRTSLLLSLLNVFLKVRAVYFTVDSTTSGAFQCSACSAGAPATCTSSTINLLGVEGPFWDEVGPSRAVWRNFYLAGSVGAFLQLLKCFSKLLVQLRVWESQTSREPSQQPTILKVRKLSNCGWGSSNFTTYLIYILKKHLLQTSLLSF